MCGYSPCADDGTTQLFILNDIATVEYWTPAQTDLSALGGPQDGWVYDCRVQSINISTGELLFEWSSLAHVPVEDTYYSLDEREGDNGWAVESRESPKALSELGDRSDRVSLASVRLVRANVFRNADGGSSDPLYPAAST